MILSGGCHQAHLESGYLVLLGAICDACRRAMGGSATNVQLVTGEIIQTGLSATLRNTRPPESYNLCADCAGPVYEYFHQATRRVAVGE